MLNYMGLIPHILPIILSGLAGLLIGYNRSKHDKPAGMRDFALVGMGAALFTIVSQNYSCVIDPNGSRIAANILTGMGFLGAGIIFQSRGSVHGISTAAGLWMITAIGMLFATNMFPLALFSTIITFLVFKFLNY